MNISRLCIIVFLFLSFHLAFARDSVNSTILCTGNQTEVTCNGQVFELQTSTDTIEPLSMWFWIYIGICIFLVLFAGLMSGLTIGLMSLDPMTLEVIKKGGDPQERKYAEMIIPVVSRHHLLLVTLLLSNAAAMEALPIFLDRISSPIIAIVVSVTMVLFFGEIIPQALCHRFGLAIGARLAWFVKILMVLLFIVAWPISKLLDLVLGHGGSKVFKRTELKELVSMHGQDHKGPLTIDETTIIKGALDLKNKAVQTFMTPLDQVMMLEMNTPLNVDTMRKIKESGHSRIPIYLEKRSEIKGILLVKSLLFVNLESSPKISDLELREIPRINANLEAYEILNMFQTGKSHMAMVCDNSKQAIGIVTLEDIIEELIQEEIYDEEDLAEIYAEQAKQALQQLRTYKRGLSFSLKNKSKLKKDEEDIQRLVQENGMDV